MTSKIIVVTASRTAEAKNVYDVAMPMNCYNHTYNDIYLDHLHFNLQIINYAVEYDWSKCKDTLPDDKNGLEIKAFRT